MDARAADDELVLLAVPFKNLGAQASVTSEDPLPLSGRPAAIGGMFMNIARMEVARGSVIGAIVDASDLDLRPVYGAIAQEEMVTELVEAGLEREMKLRKGSTCTTRFTRSRSMARSCATCGSRTT